MRERPNVLGPDMAGNKGYKNPTGEEARRRQSRGTELSEVHRTEKQRLKNKARKGSEAEKIPSQGV